MTRRPDHTRGQARTSETLQRILRDLLASDHPTVRPAADLDNVVVRIPVLDAQHLARRLLELPPGEDREATVLPFRRPEGGTDG